MNTPLREAEEDSEIQVGCIAGEVRTVAPNEWKATAILLLISD